MSWLDQMDDILIDGHARREVDDGIHSVLTDADAGFYDRGAWIYDLVVGNRAYNRLLWGCSVPRYHEACAQAVAASDGPMIDVGCGSAVFTADTYGRTHDRLVVLVDRSIAMLKRARDRLRSRRDGRLDNLILLQADATRLPFRPGTTACSTAWGVLHVVRDPSGFVEELSRVTRPGGAVHVSSLMTDRSFGRGYLRLLQSTGEIASLLSSRDAVELLRAHGIECEAIVHGNMAFLAGRTPGGRG